MKWTKMTISDLPLNKIFRISLETWFAIRHANGKESKENQLSHCGSLFSQEFKSSNN